MIMISQTSRIVLRSRWHFITTCPAVAAIWLVKGVPRFGVYLTTKAALHSFARTWGINLKDYNIRVNIVRQDTVVTSAHQSELGMTDTQIEAFVAQAAATIPTGRTNTPHEIAKAVLFLASDKSSFVNGVELFLDHSTAPI
jgi:NAD(P)-dependent dehydrogenase (short-subunit alcohol dehydrogenase family)